MTDSPRILTIRVVKSLEYRNIKNLLVHGSDLNMKVSEFKKYVLEKIQTTAGFLPFRTLDLNTMKIFFIPHKQKPNNLTINLENDENYILKDDLTLSEQGVADYQKYKSNPTDKWYVSLRIIINIIKLVIVIEKKIFDNQISSRSRRSNSSIFKSKIKKLVVILVTL
ncbi:hypothetical protein PPL_04147 [Heterostelium album PN500]|uniref:Uncharacterized protein n=1 Tax=Heterostelium pallidum (strain ATCC 26659 / Pp 5 / PN500) TaxID=670386 RepID=D3B656_HETP5|nr:hypothetical protein PPL_04147 [Heterostelium album PN500]EFA83354.1 hypothetical protein PPL_04147 [Heterostelium album PN500]|eukprot:XP_020435471.1 hypothetical protein PPL_04147 [Heterostelium album PN500]